MKLGDLAPWAATAISAVVAAFTGIKLRDERAKDTDAKADREQVGRDGYYKGLVDTLLSERVELLARIDAQDKRADVQDQKMEQMRSMMDDLHTAAIRDKLRIEQLQGELRQEKQLKSSAASLRSREPDAQP